MKEKIQKPGFWIPIGQPLLNFLSNRDILSLSKVSQQSAVMVQNLRPDILKLQEIIARNHCATEGLFDKRPNCAFQSCQWLVEKALCNNANVEDSNLVVQMYENWIKNGQQIAKCFFSYECMALSAQTNKFIRAKGPHIQQ